MEFLGEDGMEAGAEDGEDHEEEDVDTVIGVTGIPEGEVAARRPRTDSCLS